ncbi:MAG: hypothetical protein OJF59_001164 [Cytophagales bacterium]|jgi:hypothetical protein|nr:hypothetical protein [Bacteroidota bacterium]MBS1981794.1 hypothetical protein [Bacteroidota bacterium]WHZ07411.1 MAG: hypothetical protein OJF59_001164 [Cytophagales bacterium]
MQRLIFESSPAYILLCFALGLGYAFLLYRSKHIWSKKINQLLFVLRFAVVSLLSFLLVGPVLKLITNTYEKPTLALILDNSASLAGKVDSAQMEKDLLVTTRQWKDAGYEVVWRNLSGNEINQLKQANKSSDLTGALRSVVNEFEGKNLSGIVLLSDGIYNSGTSPLFTSWRVPITTVGLGDTTEHADLILKNVAYNKIAYQGNQFPVRAEVAVQHLASEEVTVSVLKNGIVLHQQKKNSGSKSIMEFDFLIDAKDKGMQSLTVVVTPVANEYNLKNNQTSVFVDVVEGKKKILVIAPAPHPDLKALRSVVEKNSNYEFILHIPGISKTDPKLLQPDQTELVVFYNPIDYEAKTNLLHTQLSQSKSSILYILGRSSNLRLLQTHGIPFAFSNSSQTDEVTPVANFNFSDFSLPEKSNTMFASYPPVQVPLGKFIFPPNARALLNQRIGNVATDRPLILFWDESGKKRAAILGDGFWQWRMAEFSKTEKTETFDDVFLKTIQYLSTLEDKRKFKFFTLQNEFSEDIPVTFEGQVYNDLFEKIYGNKIDITLRDAKGKTTLYDYVLSPGGERYRIGGMKEGAYQFMASTVVNSKKENVSGRFLVLAQNIEQQNQIADFGLLRKLAQATGGKFFKFSGINQLAASFSEKKTAQVIHSEETFNPLIQAKGYFFLLLLLVSAEWFLRKYRGGY